MSKTGIIISLLVGFSAFSQTPNYLELSKRDKFKFMNSYGFLIKKSGDTLLTQIKVYKGTNVPEIDQDQKLLLAYPEDLQEYADVDRIALKEVDRFYFGFPGRFNVVKKHDTTFVPLEVIEEKTFHLYVRTQKETQPGSFTSIPFGNGMSYTMAYDIEVKTLYLSKENSEMVHIIGDKKEKRKQLASILKNDLDPKKLKKLKTSNYDIIKLVKKLNSI
ncbi:MAG: hypothetical protein ACJAT0_002419 [Nonlabens sp.]|jgi:hypothetical protein